MIRAVIFDVVGTVVDWRDGVAAVARETFAAKGIDADPHAFADAWRGQYQPAMESVRSGGRPYVALDDLHLENLRHVLGEVGLADAFGEEEIVAFNAAWEKLPPWPDSVPGIAAMRQAGLLAATCSNGSIAMMSRLARFTGIEWDCILGADVARAYKPDPLAYRRSVAALRLEPAEVVLVAAHNDDLAAARREGLRTAFILRPLERGPGQGIDLAPTADWDFVAPDMVALARMLAG